MRIPDAPQVAIAKAAGRAFVRRCERDGTQAMVEQVASHAWAPLIHCLALADTPAPILRAVLEEAWILHNWNMRAGGMKGARLLKVFRRARFDVSGLPEVFTAWRGTRSLPGRPCGLPELAEGMSWSLRRETAAWYAMKAWRYSNPGGMPLVARRTVRREHVVYLRDVGRDGELMIDGPVQGLAIDGNPQEWRTTAEAESERRREIAWAILTGPDTIQQRRQMQSILYTLEAIGVEVTPDMTAEKVVEALKARMGD